MYNLKFLVKYITKNGILLLFKKLYKKSIRKFILLRLRNKVTTSKISTNYFAEYRFQQIKEFIKKMPDIGFKKNIIKIRQNKLFQNRVSEVLKEANRFCNNEFNILGTSWIKWQKEDNIDWQTDKKSGHTWDNNIYYTKINKTPRNGVDIKIPWELSRFNFLFGLYFSYTYIGKEMYLEKIKYFIRNWIKENPPYFGVNWTCTMEIAIRAANWSLILHSLKYEIFDDVDFTKKVIRSLSEHLFYIENNLEDIGLINSNHYIANISGFLVTNLLFPIYKNSKKWTEFTSQELRKEIERQIYNDGVHFESSTCYHRLVTEFFSLPLYLSRKLHLNLFKENYKQKLKTMYKFALNSLKSNGLIPQFGDNDSGRFFKLFNRASLEQGYLLSVGYGLFGDREFCIKEIPFDIISYIFFGEKSLQEYNSYKRSIHTLPSKEYKDSGVYILRNKNFFVAVSCMPNGRNGFGVHSHNDRLSFVLNYKGKDIIVDPGTYVYNSYPELRNKFRSTAYHNTVQENAFEQNNFGDNVFEMANDAIVSVNKFSNNLLDCQHNGFVKKGGSIHRRKFMLFDNHLVVEDHLDSNHKSKVFLHFAPRIEITNIDKTFLIKRGGKSLLKLVVDNFVESSIKDYDYSPGYGELLKCKKIIIASEKKLKMSFFEGI